MSVVHYKFKNNLDYKTIPFDGLSISLGDLKRAIMAQNKTKTGEFRLEIKNAQNSEVYKDDATQIPKNASVVIRRIPIKPVGKALTAAEKPESPGNTSAKPIEGQDDEIPPAIPLNKLNKVADLANANASEDDKISAMMNQAGEDWDPSLYARSRGRYSNVAPRAPPPAHYLCFRCRKSGHWIQNCPTNGDPNYDMKVRRTTGIPKSFLRLADNPTQKGALLIAETGQYAVPIVDHHAYEQAATRKKAKDGSSTGVEMEIAIPREYLCPICKKVMTNAVVIPCCGESFCDECVVSSLLEKEHVCPLCGTDDISPDSIVINKHLRQAIIKFRAAKTDVSFPAASLSAQRVNTIKKERSTTPVPLPVSTPAVTNTADENEPPSDPVVATSTETSQVKSREPSPSKASEVATTSTPPSTQPGPNESQTQDTKTAAAVAKDTAAYPRQPQGEHQVPEGYVHPLRMPAAASLQPIHRPSYVVSGSGLAHPHAHHHHAIVHATVPSLGIPGYGRMPHPAMLPGHPPLPFGGPDMGMMMNEEEFYRAKLNFSGRGRRNRRSDDEPKRKKDRSRSRHRRERRESPSSRRTPPGNEFELELSKYEVLQRDRLRRRSRSRSWSPSASSSRSSWSHSWSRSKSPSRSYSRSKSRTPVNWDRSRSPSPLEKAAKPARADEDGKKRKKHGTDPGKKRSKLVPTAKEDVGKTSENVEGKSGTTAETKTDGKMKEGKECKEKSQKKESRKKEIGVRDVSGKKEETKISGEEKLSSLKDKKGKGDIRSSSPKTGTSQIKTKLKPTRESSPLVKTSRTTDSRKKEGSSRGNSPVERRTVKEKSKTEFSRGSASVSAAGKSKMDKKKYEKKAIAKESTSVFVARLKEEEKETKKERTKKEITKKETTRDSASVSGKTTDVKEKRIEKRTRENEREVDKNVIVQVKKVKKTEDEKTKVKKKDDSKRDTSAVRRGSVSKSSTKGKTLARLDSSGERQVRKGASKVHVSRAEKREKLDVKPERKKSVEKPKERSLSNDVQEQSLEEAKVKKHSGKKKKRKKAASDTQAGDKSDDRRTSRKRSKGDEDDVTSEVTEKTPKKKKKKRHGMVEEQAKDDKVKKRSKHKKKKHKHKKKTKHKDKKKEEQTESTEASGKRVASENEGEAASENENPVSERAKTMDDEGCSDGGESSRSDRGMSGDSGGKGVESGSEEDRVKEKDSDDGISLQGDEEIESGEEGDGHEDDVDMKSMADEEVEEDADEVKEEELVEDEGDREEEGSSDGERMKEVGEDSDAESGDSEEEEDMDEIQDEGDDEEDGQNNEGFEVSDVEGQGEEEEDEVEEEGNEEKEEAMGKIEENEDILQESGETKENVESEDEADILGDDDSIDLDEVCDGESDDALLQEDAADEEHSEKDSEELLEDEEDSDDASNDDESLGEDLGTNEALDEITEDNLNESEENPEVKGGTETRLPPGDILPEFGYGKEDEISVDEVFRASGENKATVGPIGENEVTLGLSVENKVTLGPDVGNEVTLGPSVGNEVTLGSIEEPEASVLGSSEENAVFFKPYNEHITSGSKVKHSDSLRNPEQRYQFEKNNGFGVKRGTATPRPRNMKYKNYEQFDSGVETLSSLDSIPELDDPNYTDFDSDPVPIEYRRTSTDIFRALIEEGPDF